MVEDSVTHNQIGCYTLDLLITHLKLLNKKIENHLIMQLLKVSLNNIIQSLHNRKLISISVIHIT